MFDGTILTLISDVYQDSYMFDSRKDPPLIKASSPITYTKCIYKLHLSPVTKPSTRSSLQRLSTEYGKGYYNFKLAYEFVIPKFSFSSYATNTGTSKPVKNIIR